MHATTNTDRQPLRKAGPNGATIIPIYSFPVRKLISTSDGFYIVSDDDSIIPDNEAAAIIRRAGNMEALADWLNCHKCNILIVASFFKRYRVSYHSIGRQFIQTRPIAA